MKPRPEVTVGLALAAVLALLPPVVAEPGPSRQLSGSAVAEAPPDASEAALRQAVELVQQENLEGAIAILDPLREDPSASPVALAMLGALYAEIGLPEDALAVLAPIADGERADPAVLYNAGRAAVQMGRHEQGEAYLGRSVSLVPVSPAARFLGLLLGGRGRILEAYELLGPWVEANPGDEEARRAAAVCALRLRRLPEARTLLDGLPEDDVLAALLRGELLLQNREPEAAVALLEPLAETLPPELEVDWLQLLSSALLETGQSSSAAELLEGRHLAHPKLALSLARARYQGGDAVAALAAVEPLAQQLLVPEQTAPAVASGPLAAAIVLEYGRLLVAVDRAADAIPALERAAELDRWNGEAWQLQAQALAATGRRQEAEAALERFRELSEARERASVPGMKGRRLLDDTTGRRLTEAAEWLERGQPEEALNIARQEISLVPEDLRPRLFEAGLLLAAGRLDDALRSVTGALELAPDDPDVLGLAARIRVERGEPAEARRLLERVLELRPGDEAARGSLEALAGSGS
jgi:tetratricopeptide (TPR) repeat protein